MADENKVDGNEREEVVLSPKLEAKARRAISSP